MIGPLLALAAAGVGGLGYWHMHRRALDRWLPSYLASVSRRRPVQPGEPVHLLLCVADHYEPSWGKPSPDVAQRRVDAWVEQYPRLLGGFRDSDCRPPRHTFFFPQDEYVAAHVDGVVELCRQGYGEVEVHLHHDRDTADNLRAKLTAYRDLLVERHGQLARRRTTGQVAYGFIHGNWALDNSHPSGRWCGVNNELDVLRETGCYADFTLPSAPDPCQTRKINSLYYAVDDPARPRSHDAGLNVGLGKPPPDSLMLIQGPLVLDWSRRKWGLIPRVENGCLQGNQAPSAARIPAWLRARVQVPSRPDWFFVKLHTHGAPEANQRVLLGDAAVRFHEALAHRAATDPAFHFHYVSAREMYNLVRAAEAGFAGSVSLARDFELLWNGQQTVNVR